MRNFTEEALLGKIDRSRIKEQGRSVPAVEKKKAFWQMRTGAFACSDCGRTAPKRGPRHKRCDDCKVIAVRETKNRYYKRNAQKARGYRRANQAEITARKQERIDKVMRSKAVAETLSYDTPNPKLLWVARFWVPFSWKGSKNYAHSYGPDFVYRNAASKDYEADVIFLAQNALREIPVKQNKIWIGLLVEKPSHRGDAVNFVDTICDALKKAIGIDDRWFSIRYIDWRINRVDPAVFIEIGQEADWNGQICSCCGEIKRFADFPIRTSNKQGIGRICLSCREASHVKPNRISIRPAPLQGGAG